MSSTDMPQGFNDNVSYDDLEMMLREKLEFLQSCPDYHSDRRYTALVARLEKDIETLSTTVAKKIAGQLLFEVSMLKLLKEDPESYEIIRKVVIKKLLLNPAGREIRKLAMQLVDIEKSLKKFNPGVWLHFLD